MTESTAPLLEPIVRFPPSMLRLIPEPSAAKSTPATVRLSEV